MLRWISKSGTFIQFIIFTVLLATLWVPAIVAPRQPVITPQDGPLYTLLADAVMFSPLVSVSLALILIALQAFLLNNVYRSNGFFGRNNMLPAIILMLAYSWSSDYQTLHAIIPATLFVIFALHSIMRLYGQHAAYQQLFVASFCTGLAALFYIPLAYLLLMLWFTLITYRVSSWREYAVSVIGYTLPFIYYLSWLFWNDNLPAGLIKLSESVYHLVIPSRISLINTIWLSVSAFMLLVSMIAVLNNMNDKLISLRRRSWVLFNFSFTALIATLLTGWPILTANYIFVIPLSFFITGSFILIKRSFWFEMFALAYFLLFAGMRIYLFSH